MSEPLRILLDRETEAVVRLIEGPRWLVTYEKRRPSFRAIALSEREIRGLVLEMVGSDQFAAAMAMPADEWSVPDTVRAWVRSDVGSIDLRPDLSASLDVHGPTPSIRLHRTGETIELNIAWIFIAIAAAEFLIERSSQPRQLE